MRDEVNCVVIGVLEILLYYFVLLIAVLHLLVLERGSLLSL